MEVEAQVISCWTIKGGSGGTVISVALALLSSASGARTVLVDAVGDVPAVLGAEEGPNHKFPGLHQWLVAGEGVPSSAIERLVEPLDENLSMMRSGTTEPHRSASGRSTSGKDELRQVQRMRDALDGCTVIVDSGVCRSEIDSRVDTASVLRTEASLSVLVIRPCFLALTALGRSNIRPDVVVVIEEAGRALDHRDVEDVAGVTAITVRWDDRVARAVDAGRLRARLPKSLRPLQALVEMSTTFRSHAS